MADENVELITALRDEARRSGSVHLVDDPATADALILNEKFSFKEQRYVDRLSRDKLVGRYPEKIYTLNFDDCATGLLRGLYSSLPRSRFDGRLHAAIPYFRYHNPLVFSTPTGWPPPEHLAAWRGNVASHVLRKKMLSACKGDVRFAVEPTASWYNHKEDEKARYVEMILDAKFSLCPAGLAPVSFRIFESMALGRAPVLIADNYVYPRGPEWAAFSLAVPEREVTQLGERLARREAEAEVMGRNARVAWERYFAPDALCGFLLGELKRLVSSGPSATREQEIGRWRSWHVWQTNGWTLPQRAWRRLKREIRKRQAGGALER